MNNELLRIVLPSRFSVCGECEFAIALASRISTPHVQELASQYGMGPDTLLQIHCHDWVNSRKPVPDPRTQTAMQAQMKDSQSMVGVTESIIVICPGKATCLASQQPILIES